MWNFGIPYKLKHYIDLLVQPGLTFGLGAGRPVPRDWLSANHFVAIYSRGGAYGPGSGAETADQQSTYLKQILGFIGFTDIREIFIEPTLRDPDAREEALTSANRKAVEIAAQF